MSHLPEYFEHLVNDRGLTQNQAADRLALTQNAFASDKQRKWYFAGGPGSKASAKKGGGGKKGASTAATGKGDEPKMTLPGFMGKLSEAKRESLFAAMRSLGDKSDAARQQARRLAAPHGTIGLGSADMDYTFKAEAIDAVIRHVRKGASPAEAETKAKEDMRQLIKSWNERGSKSRASVSGNYELHRWEGHGDSHVETARRQLEQSQK